MKTKLDYYRIFYETARHSSFSTAARHLYISQSAISQCIHQLEEDLNTKLLDQGYLNGSIILSPSSDLIDMVEDEVDMDAAAAGLALSSISLKLDFEQENDNNFKLAMHIMSGRNAYASVTLDTAIAKGKSISLPKDSTEDTEEWVADFDFNSLLDVVNESELPDFIVELVETYVMLLQWS